MKRINKNRKGVIFGLMTKEEQDCLKAQENVRYYTPNEDWELVSLPKLTEHAKWCTSVAYWCPDWDTLTGSDLIGKLCRYGREGFGVCESYTDSEDMCNYFINSAWRHSARLATKEEALRLVQHG